MIYFFNGYFFEYMVVSGVFVFDGKGWFWEYFVCWFGLLCLEFFIVVMKMVICELCKGNLSWFKFW